MIRFSDADICVLYLIILEGRGKEKDEGGQRGNSGNGEEEAAVVSAVRGDDVGGVDGGLDDGSVDQHVGSRGSSGRAWEGAGKMEGWCINA